MPHARLHRLDEITLKTLRSLDRACTAVLLPVGMLEEHGNHLPFGTDTYAVNALTLAAAAWLLDNDPDLHILLMPTIPYGTDPVDLRRPDVFADAGSVWISSSTLKQIVIDAAGHMIRYGFRHIFPIGFHGGAGQSIALEEACAALRAEHPGLVMVEPLGYVMAGAEVGVTPGLATLLGRPLTAAEEVILKGSIHASMFETSMMLHLRPDLVDPSYKQLRSLEWRDLFQMEDWPGYVGSGPAHANREIGAAVLRWRGVRAAALIRRALSGEDVTSLPRHPHWSSEVSPAESVSEAPAGAELSPGHEPYIESNPALVIPREKLAEMAAALDIEQSRAGEAANDATPPSSVMETRPFSRRPDAEPQPDQDAADES